MSYYKVNGFTICASSLSEALEFVFYVGKARPMIVNIDGRDLKMLVTTENLGPFLEDNIATTVMKRLESIGIEYSVFDVCDEEKNWLASSEV